MKSFLCKECNNSFNSYQSLRNHIRWAHKEISQQEYYDKWFGKGFCKVCGKSVNFISLLYGYKSTCSKECREKYKLQKRTKTNLKKYGVENVFQSEKIKNKIKQSLIKKYGVNNPKKYREFILKGKETCLRKYGNKNYNNSELREKTNLNKYGFKTILEDKNKIKQLLIKKYGVDNVSKLEWVKEKMKLTWLKKYGVDHPSKNPNIHKKQNGFIAKKFKNTNIYYRGSYELDFLNRYYDKFNIVNSKYFKYTLNDNDYIYYPDFFILQKKLIIEIKSSWVLKNQDFQKTEAKKETVINKGFNYIMIIDKNYNEFEKLCFSQGYSDCCCNQSTC